jgi:hypothetical protein
MAFKLPNGSTFDHAATYSTANTITSISNATQAVVTGTHAYSVGDVVLITSGWVKLTGRAFRVKTVSTTVSFTIDLDTTNTAKYPVGSSAGTSKKVATWVNIPQITAVSSTGGEQQFYTFGFLEDSDDRQLPTTKTPSVLTLTVADDPAQPFVPVVEAADENKTIEVQRLNLINGDVVMYASVTSISYTPTLERNNLMTRTITLAQQGRVTRYVAP